MIDISVTGEDMENISLCIFQYLTSYLYYIINKNITWLWLNS
jgi:hypothetical protein